MISCEMKTTYWEGVQELVAEKNGICFPEILKPGHMLNIGLETLERLTLPFTHPWGRLDEAIGQLWPGAEDVASQLAGMGALFNHAEGVRKVQRRVDLPDLASQEFAKARPNADAGKIVSRFSDGAGVTIITVLGMIERKVHKFFKRNAARMTAGSLADDLKKGRAVVGCADVHSAATLVRLKKSDRRELLGG
jgi:hypothetical protein